MQKKNNKGFSLVELVVVIAIMSLAVSFVGASFVSVYRARSKRAAETFDAVISQCKIDALSGLDCELKVELVGGDYYANLYRTETTIDDEGNSSKVEVSYKSEKLASDRLKIYVGSETNPISENPLVIKFNHSTGAFQKVQYGDNPNVFGDSSVQTVITLSSTDTHTITLYKTTGEHVLDA